jgi:preprotein translocase subunit SecD
MKILFILLITLFPVSNSFSQEKNIETGLYLIIPPDSCLGKSNIHAVKYLSDTVCIGEQPVIRVRDIESCITDSSKINSNEVYFLNIKLKNSVVSKFKEVTAKNTGKKLALVIDSKIVSAPVIRDPITSGRMTFGGDKEPIIKELGVKLREKMRNNNSQH